MKYVLKFLTLMAVAATTILSGCNDTESYAEMLAKEDKASNAFLVNQKVVSKLPADSVLEYGINAPFYKLDEDGDIFMQVINPGTSGNKAEIGQLIYFRFTRYNLFGYSYDGSSSHPDGYYGEFSDSNGNASDMTMGSASFRYNSYTFQNSQEWGTGIQMPLLFLPIDCEVNVLIKSRIGITSEQSAVTPYLYHVRYFKSQI